MKKTPFFKAITTSEVVRALVILCVFSMAAPAFAQGGLQKVNAFAATILAVLHGVAIAAVTIAIMWTGFKMLFQHQAIQECGRVIMACLLIGGAAELGAYFAS
jgi:hypothetical protein